MTIFLDYLTGPLVPIPYGAIVVLLAAYYDRLEWGLAYALVLPFARLAQELMLPTRPWPVWVSITNMANRQFVLVIMAVIAGRLGERTRRVHLLEGILPICMYCHRIQGPDGAWSLVETYVTDHSQALFSHGICPLCLDTRGLK